MANFTVKLTDLTVKAWFPPTQPLEEPLIENATGTYTASIFGTSVGYYLQVDHGTRVNPLRLGQPVVAVGKDPEGKWVTSEVLETTDTGEVAMFKGPYEAAIKHS